MREGGIEGLSPDVFEDRASSIIQLHGHLIASGSEVLSGRLIRRDGLPMSAANDAEMETLMAMNVAIRRCAKP